MPTQFQDFKLEKNSKTPYHVQIYDYLLKKIKNGEFSEGEKLPNEGNLSLLLGVSRITVRGALRGLELKGEIIRTRGIGTVIADNNLKNRVTKTDSRNKPKRSIVEYMQPQVGSVSQKYWKPVIRPAKNEYKIAYGSLAKGYWWYHSLVEQSMVETARSMGCRAFVLNNNLEYETAIKNAETVIELYKKGELDFFINAQFHKEANEEISNMLKSEKVPSCSVDIALPDFPYFHVNDYTGNFLSGEWLGNYALSKNWSIGKIEFIYFDQIGSPEISVLRREGALNGLRSVIDIKKDNITIVKLNLGKFENARKKMLKWLKDHPSSRNILVAGIHTYPTLGALSALRKLDREQDAVICGLGGAKEEFEEVIKPFSAYKAVVSTFPEKYGSIAIPFAIDYLEGLPVPADFVGYTAIMTKDNLKRFYPDFFLK